MALQGNGYSPQLQLNAEGLQQFWHKLCRTLLRKRNTQVIDINLTQNADRLCWRKIEKYPAQPVRIERIGQIGPGEEADERAVKIGKCGEGRRAFQTPGKAEKNGGIDHG